MQTISTDSGATLHFDDVGTGACVLALHGAYSTHLEIAAALEPILAPSGAYRRLYPDLVGMGESPAHDSIRTTDDLVALLEHLVDEVVGDAPLLVVGHSYGAHLARAIAARRPHQVSGLALICPMVPNDTRPEPHVAIRPADDAIDLVDPSLRDDFTGYFVVQTPATAERFNAAVAPSTGRFDGAAVERVMETWAVEPDPDTTPFVSPTLIVAGRSDSVTGYRGPLTLVDVYPRATFAVLADAGHALPHERPDVLAALLTDWLARI